MNNEKMLPNRCHEWIQGLKSPVFTDFFEPMKSFPLFSEIIICPILPLFQAILVLF
mgnify:CR=1 FL=1